MAFTCNCNCKFPLLLLLLLLFVLILDLGLESCYGQQTFSFDVHHRFSDHISKIFPLDHLPEKGSFDYYSALAHRDPFFHGRRLANTSNDDKILTFADGNTTVSSLGFLYYANVSLGTPSVTFFVALDTGSDLFWVPCDCVSCVRTLRTSNGDVNLNIYSPNASLTSKKVPCNSSMCEQKNGCHLLNQSTCLYRVVYISALTSTSGYLVEDVLHLKTDYSQSQTVDAHVTFGCGQVETGSFLDSGAFNGLLGLGMNTISVPSILSSANLIANSFSMCFGSDGIGRINFGDKGIPNQAETKFNVNQSNPTYDVNVTQITVGKNVMNVNFTANFDTGTSFTYLTDTVYTHLSKSFNAQVQDKRRPSDPNNDLFEYCYDPSSNFFNSTLPALNLTMGGGGQFSVSDPIIVIANETTIQYYCLAVIKSKHFNIIGQNFMTNYLIVFDREKLVLGWSESDCYASNGYNSTKTQPKTTTAPPPKSPRSYTAILPPTAAEPGGVYPSSSGATSGVCNCFSLLFLLVCFAIFSS